MVFDRRFTADSPRYPAIRSNRQKQSDGLRPPLQDYCVLLTRSFLMVLGRVPPTPDLDQRPAISTTSAPSIGQSGQPHALD